MTDETGAESPFDPSRLAERAMRSVLNSVPDMPDSSVPEAAGRLQPWADVAAPMGKNKRPLEALLAEYEERLQAAPESLAGKPQQRSASELFFERLSRPAKSGGRGGRGGRGGGNAAAPVQGQQQPGTGARRRRRRGGGGGSGTPTGSAAGAPREATGRPPMTAGAQPSSPATGEPGGAARRRRRRRGRRGGGSGGGAAAPPASG